jgi:hypothetical protein
MKIRSHLSSAAVATAAMLAFWFTFGGPQVVRADEPETASSPGQEMVLVPAKSIDALEHRVIYLEEMVAALSERWQHIRTHQLCVSDDSGAETCITKAQLDSFLNQAPHAEINQPAVLESAEASPPAAQIESAATEPLLSSEPTTMAPHAEINQPAVLESAEASPPAAPIESATTEPLLSSEPTAIVGENVAPDQEPETNGTVNSAISSAAPEIEEDPGF